MEHNEDKYAQDGVRVSLGDRFSSFAGDVCRSTYENDPRIGIRDFSDGFYRGPKGFETMNLPPGTIFDISPDGIGTKSIMTDAAMMHHESAADWMAMTGGDITRFGGCPVLFVNSLDVSSLGESERSLEYAAAQNLILGMKSVADRYGYVLYKGETAELSSMVASENEAPTLKYIWGGSAFGFFNKKNIITGKNVCVGQKIVALREWGLRSNGGSTARAGFRSRFGLDWPNNLEAKRYVEMAAKPSVIYDRFLSEMNGWDSMDLEPIVPVSLIAHLTGGSFRGKFFSDFLKRHGFSAILNDLWNPPEIMNLIGEWRGMNPVEFYDTFNGGQGALVVMEDGYVDIFIGFASRHSLEAKVCGEILQSKGYSQLTIRSKFASSEEFVIKE